jgi:hypothetical protein
MFFPYFNIKKLISLTGISFFRISEIIVGFAAMSWVLGYLVFFRFTQTKKRENWKSTQECLTLEQEHFQALLAVRSVLYTHKGHIIFIDKI